MSDNLSGSHIHQCHSKACSLAVEERLFHNPPDAATHQRSGWLEY